MAPKSLLVAAAVLLAACSSGDDDATTTTRPTGACPLPAAVVANAVGHAVNVEPGDERGACAYVADADIAPGGRVEIVVRSLTDDEGFAAALAEVERRSGPTVSLGDGGSDVDGADRGWVATVGRAVQVGAADDARLVVVVVSDPLLDAEAAEKVAARLAAEVLSG